MRKLSRKELFTSITLFLVFFVCAIFSAFLRGVPGYMDESYYLVSARNLAAGNGFQENLIWNFMDDPEGLPHDSHLYWMPMVSIISATGMKVFGLNYLAASLPHALIAAFIAPCVYLSLKLWIKDQFWAVVGGILAILGGYYFAYYSAGDAFSLYMLIGYGYFVVISRIFTQNQRNIVISGLTIGVLAGIMHLTRADGLIWAAMIPFFFTFAAIIAHKQGKISLRPYILGAVLGLGLYFLFMSPWYLRNLENFGSLTAKGSSSNLFITTYNDLFSYPATVVTLQRWLETGWAILLRQRADAAATNLLSILGVQLLVFQLPFALVGVWNNRKSVWVQVNLFCMAILFIFFSVLFPLAGQRGGFFHSGTAFQIFLWVMSISGLRAVVVKLPLSEGINRNKFEQFIGVGFLFIVLTVSGVLSFPKFSSWDAGVSEIVEIEHALEESEISTEEIILINDPATFHWVTFRPTIVIPSGDESTILSVMDRYGADLVVLQINHPPELSGLYLAPSDSESFDVVHAQDTWFILRKVSQE